MSAKSFYVVISMAAVGVEVMSVMSLRSLSVAVAVIVTSVLKVVVTRRPVASHEPSIYWGLDQKHKKEHC
jgi:hypothetical protein